MCGKKLTIANEWHESLTTVSCLQDSVSIEWNMKASSIHGRFGTSSTVSDIQLDFQKELFKLC
jgi:hypothetical protein